MVFSSTIFLLFFLPAVLVLYHMPLRRFKSYKNIVLLLASLIFYAWGEPLFIFILLISIFLNWFICLKIDASQSPVFRKICLWSALFLDIGLLAIFKYLVFVIKNIVYTFHVSMYVPDIELPIGISFFTFQIISYVLDIYWKKAPVQKNVLNLALYISMFPQLIAGPIVRYADISLEIYSRKETLLLYSNGVRRFIIGLGKKVIISNYLALIADNIFAVSMSELSCLSAWLGAVSYSLQIYFDFSGYSDMAIGLGYMFGFHFKENFNYPYTSKSIAEFWRRWHISLGQWFRDYVYIPLGGNKVSKSRWVFNSFIVWFLTGLWHGANWTFIAWGLFYFSLIVIEKFTKIDIKLKLLSHIYTVILVVIAWVIFRSDSLHMAINYILAMFNINANGFYDAYFIYYISQGKYILPATALLAFPVVPFLKKKMVNSKFNLFPLIYNLTENLSYIIIFLLSLTLCVKSSYNPFIYFNF